MVGYRQQVASLCHQFLDAISEGGEGEWPSLRQSTLQSVQCLGRGGTKGCRGFLDVVITTNRKQRGKLITGDLYNLRPGEPGCRVACTLTGRIRGKVLGHRTWGCAGDSGT